MNPFKLLNPSYLFDTRPGSEFMFFWPLLFVFVAIFIGSFKVKASNIAARMREFSILGLILTFFRDQNIPFLGMRLWIVLLFVAALAYAVWIWKGIKKAAMHQPIAEKKREDKYLPKKKSKKKSKRT